jgi:hypothetical protein
MPAIVPAREMDTDVNTENARRADHPQHALPSAARTVLAHVHINT